MSPTYHFDYTTGNPDNLVGGHPAAMIDLQGSFYDLRAFLNSGVFDALAAITPPVSIATAAPVLDVGLAGQVRAGRQLALADFATVCALPTVPVGLWNLGDLTNLGSGGALTNKGAIPFGVGINGQAASAAVFAGSTGQALFIADTGAADPFRIRTGSWGCWVRTAKRGVSQSAMTKRLASTQWAFSLRAPNASNVAEAFISGDGTSTGALTGVSDIADDRWHHVITTLDGTLLRLYVDGALEGVFAAGGVIFQSSAPFNIGGFGADGATAAGEPHYGRIDEAFVTADVLTDDQIRLLYCAKLAHTLGAVPTRANLLVRRRRKGGSLLITDFPATPVRLHNFTAGSLNDEGSGGVALVSNPGTGAIVAVAGADGTLGSAYSFSGAHTGLSATDAGLPAATAARTYGCWFKLTAGAAGFVGWGTMTTAYSALRIGSTGVLAADNGADVITGPFVTDGQWHFAVAVEDNAAGDGVRRKLYLDGRLVGGSTVLNPITLAGANRFRVGAYPDGTFPFSGQVDGAFVSALALTMEQVAALYAKGTQALVGSIKEPGAHVEAMDATSAYITFDTLDSQQQIDLAVAA